MDTDNNLLVLTELKLPNTHQIASVTPPTVVAAISQPIDFHHWKTNLLVPSQESERSCRCVLRVSSICPSLRFSDCVFIIVPTMWNFVPFYQYMHKHYVVVSCSSQKKNLFFLLKGMIWIFILGFFQSTDADEYYLIPDSSSWVHAHATCKAAYNSSLVTMTERIYVELTYLLSNDQRIENETEFKFWTNHRTDLEMLYFDISYEDFPQNTTQGSIAEYTYCVYGIFEKEKKRFGWSATKCESKYPSICWLVEEAKDPPLNVTLFAASYNTNHAEAEDICSKRGERLLEMEDAAKQATLMYFFSQDLWKHANVFTFWTSHMSKEWMTDINFRPLPSHQADGTTNYPYCVYGIYDASFTVELFGWKTSKCDANHTIMCQKPLDDCYYTEHTNTQSVDEVINTETKSIKLCKRECKLLVLEEQQCEGFNYDPVTGRCTYIHLENKRSVTVQRSDVFNFHQRVCTIRPLLQEDSSTLNKAQTLGENYLRTTIHEDDDHEWEMSTVRESSCSCKCQSTNKTIEQKIADIVKEIRVDRKKTSAYRRKFYSAPDARPLSTGMGLTAGCILVSIAVGVVLMDSHRIVANIHLFWKVLRNILKYR